MDDLIQVGGAVFSIFLIGIYSLFGEAMRRRSKQRDVKTARQENRIAGLEEQIEAVSSNAQSAEQLALKQAAEIQELKQQLLDEQNTRERVVAELQTKNKTLETELANMKLQLADSKTSYNEVNAKFVALSTHRDELVAKVDNLSDELKNTRDELTTERGKTAAYHAVMVTFSQQLKFVTENKVATDELKVVETTEES